MEGLGTSVSLWVGEQLNRRGFLGWMGRSAGAVTMGVGLALGSHGLAAAQAPTCSDLVCNVCYIICCDPTGACLCCTDPNALNCEDPSCCVVPNIGCGTPSDCPLRYPSNCVSNSPKRAPRVR